ncbi:unnamed protein product [Closterium sp. NIES-54]
MTAAKRVLRYLCSTSGMGLVLGGQSPVVLIGHADASWADDQTTQRSSQGYTFSLGSGFVSWRATCSSSVLGSSCEAEIYAGAMAAQELRWLTYLLTDLGEPPRSPPVLYVDNKAMLALCREQRLEHRTKHIALRYFLARELQQRGRLRLAYVASEANTADVFTKALAPCDHQRFCTQLGLVLVLISLSIQSFLFIHFNTAATTASTKAPTPTTTPTTATTSTASTTSTAASTTTPAATAPAPATLALAAAALPTRRSSLDILSTKDVNSSSKGVGRGKGGGGAPLKEGRARSATSSTYSNCTTPILFTPKKDGGFRMCIDYRALNRVTIKSHYPIPRVDELIDQLRIARVFLKIDLRGGYHQIHVNPPDCPKTAFRTRHGSFEYTVMPFGLTNVPATFQMTMNEAFRPLLDKCVIVYLVDILIHSTDQAQHLQDIEAVFKILSENRLLMKASKYCNDSSMTELQSFFGFVNYAHRFVPDMAKLTAPLTDLLRKGVEYTWGGKEQAAFWALNNILCSPPVFHIADPHRPFELVTNASDIAVGVVLLQDFGIGLQPIAYESRKLHPPERNYPIHDCEMLAIVHTFKVWRCYLIGADMTMIRATCDDPTTWEQQLPLIEFAYNNATSATTQQPPFYLNFGQNPTVPMTPSPDNPTPRAHQFAEILQAARTIAAEAIKKANVIAKRNADRHRRPVM